MIDWLSTREKAEIHNLMVAIPRVPVLNTRPQMVLGNLPWIKNSKYDWIPLNDLEYYKQHRHRCDADFDWRSNQGGLSGFYTPGGVLESVDMLSNVPNNLLPYFWLHIVLRHLYSTYSSSFTGKNYEILEQISIEIHRLLGRNWSIDNRIKYTLPIGFTRSDYVKSFVGLYSRVPFDHKLLLKFVENIVIQCISNTIIVEQINNPH